LPRTSPPTVETHTYSNGDVDPGKSVIARRVFIKLKNDNDD